MVVEAVVLSDSVGEGAAWSANGRISGACSSFGGLSGVV